MLHAFLPYRTHFVAMLMLLAVSTPACARESSLQAQGSASPSEALAAPPYTFDRPDALFRLPNRLREISGLTVLDDQRLGAVQDEKGKLYVLNLHTGEIEDDPRFDKDGDYEGLARVGDRVFVLRSNGTLYEITNWRAKKLETVKHKTPLSAKYDTEGLVYDEAHARLLIACKEYAGKGLKNRKAIYAFDLETKTLLDEPVFTIDIRAFTEQTDAGGLNDQIRRAVQPALDLSGFKPSALALHPITGELYVLSSVRKALVVLNPAGAMTAVWVLPEKRFRQPEGLAFLPNGDLFIASEGSGKKAVIMRFNYRP
ncbi:MAG: SdiA-regulated domain-containing protein [Rhodothermales bacterium]